MLNIKLFPQIGMSHQLQWVGWFYEGLKKHGLTASAQYASAYEPCDLAVVWGHRQTRIMTEQRKAGRDYLVMERGFVKRMEYAAMGFNGLNGQADFLNADSPPDRWLQLGIEMKPWKTGGDYVILGGQIPGDATLHGYQPQQKYSELAIELANMHRRPVYWRPHPLRATNLRVPLPVQNLPLDEALEKAWSVVVISSNLAVDATISGVPTITLDSRSMAYPVTRHDLMYSLIPWRPDRRQWSYDLAYAQWNEAEIRSGEAWAHLQQKYA